MLKKAELSKALFFLILAALLFAGFYVRYDQIASAQNDEFPGSDAYSNAEDAKKTVNEGKPVGNYMNPGQILFMIPLYVAGFDDNQIRIIQAILSIIAAIYLAKTAQLLFGKQAGFVTLLFALFDPFMTYYSIHFWADQLIIMSITAFSYNFFQVLLNDKNEIWRFAILGLTTAIGALCKSWFIGVILAAGFTLYLYSKNTNEHALKTTLTILAFTIFFLSPWAIYNKITHNELVFTSTNAATNLFFGNNPYATLEFTSTYPPEMDQVYDDITVSGKTCKEWKEEKDTALLNKMIRSCRKKYSIKYIIIHPIKFISKLYNFTITYWLFPNDQAYQRYIENLDQLMNYLWIKWILAIIGLLFVINKYEKQLFLYFYFIGVWFSYAIVFYLARYKIALLPIQLIYSACGVVAILTILKTVFLKKMNQ